MVLRSIFPLWRPVPTRFSFFASASVFVPCFKLQATRTRKAQGRWVGPLPPIHIYFYMYLYIYIDIDIDIYVQCRHLTTWLYCALLLQSPEFSLPPGLRKWCKDAGAFDQAHMPYECLCSKNDTSGSLVCHKTHPLNSKKKTHKQGAMGWSIR